MTGPAGAGPTTRRVRELFTSGGFRRLVATRVTSQVGDGLFQLATADVLLFDEPGPNPALTLTALVAVTLIPFSAVIPFVGVFIDRWDRRKILTYTPAVRAVLAATVPVSLIAGKDSPFFFALVLVVLSANRLFLATMSAVLPQLVAERDLLLANSVAATGGSVATVTGLGLGAAASELIGGDRTVLVAAVTFAVAALLARTLPVRRDVIRRRRRLGAQFRAVLAELIEGLGKLRRSTRVRFAFTAVTTGQFLAGITTGATTVLFITRLNLGVGAVASLLGAIAIGLGVGVVFVPMVARRVREDFIVPISFAIGAAGVLFASAVTPLSRARMTAAAAVVGLSYAFAKIPVDTIVQEEMPDSHRGRAFAAYDMLFNIARVAGTGTAAGIVAAEVGLETIVTLSGIGYLFTSAALFVWARRIVAWAGDGSPVLRRDERGPT